MAESRPTCWHSCMNTLLSTWREAGERPKLTLERPSVVKQPGISSLMRLDGVHGLDGVAAQVVVAGGEREGEGVEDEVAGSRGRSVSRARSAMRLATRTFHSAVAGLALLVDAEADDRGAVLLGQREHPVEAGALGEAVLEVGGVEDGPAADPLEAGLDDLGLGGVEHQGRVGLGGEAAGDLVHVAGAVAADVVDADVEDVGAALDLLGGHRPCRCRSRASSMASRNFLEPLALVRSPIISEDRSCLSGTAE